MDARHFVYRPHPALRRYVREIISIRTERDRTQILLPETTLTMVLRQSGRTFLGERALPFAMISGLQKNARVIRHGAGSSLVIVRFTETGAAALLHDRVDQLYTHTAPLDSMLPQREINRVQDALAETENPEKRLLAVENFLLARMRQRYEVPASVEAAAKIIRNSGGRHSIALIARTVGMSQSALERNFRSIVGTSPKMLSRLARLQNVCRLWDGKKTLAEIAAEAGYSDQPHMNRDFRFFSNTSPEDFFRSGAPRNLPTFYK